MQGKPRLIAVVLRTGFHLDDRERHKERLRLWEDFNNAWLALTFKQKELMSSPFATPHESLMTEDTIEELGDELIRLCDGIERHGLVDYQYGVWEERIEAGKSLTAKVRASKYEGTRD